MEKIITKFKESLDALLADLSGKTEEIKENFSSFKDVFGKEFDEQSENLKEYREKLETEGKKLLNVEELFSNIRQELDSSVHNLHNAIDRFLDSAKDKVRKAQ